MHPFLALYSATYTGVYSLVLKPYSHAHLGIEPLPSAAATNQRPLTWRDDGMPTSNADALSLWEFGTNSLEDCGLSRMDVDALLQDLMHPET